MLKYPRVKETDADGIERLISLELADDAIYRTSKAAMWEGRLPYAAVIDLAVSRVGSADLVVAETKHGQIRWSLKSGHNLRDEIERRKSANN